MLAFLPDQSSVTLTVEGKRREREREREREIKGKSLKEKMKSKERRIGDMTSMRCENEQDKRLLKEEEEEIGET